MQLKFKRLSEKAVLPSFAHPTDAGMDLTATRISTEINECGQLTLVYHTDLAVQIPEGYVGFLMPRSSVSKKSLILTNCVGVIDSGYRGEIMGKFRSTTDVIPAVYKEGERFVQLVIIKLADIEPVEADELDPSDRGEGGFGSTNEEAPAAPEVNDVDAESATAEAVQAAA